MARRYTHARGNNTAEMLLRGQLKKSFAQFQRALAKASDARIAEVHDALLHVQAVLYQARLTLSERRHAGDAFEDLDDWKVESAPREVDI